MQVFTTLCRCLYMQYCVYVWECTMSMYQSVLYVCVSVLYVCVRVCCVYMWECTLYMCENAVCLCESVLCVHVRVPLCICTVHYHTSTQHVKACLHLNRIRSTLISHFNPLRTTPDQSTLIASALRQSRYIKTSSLEINHRVSPQKYRPLEI